MVERRGRRPLLALGDSDSVAPGSESRGDLQRLLPRGASSCWGPRRCPTLPPALLFSLGSDPRSQYTQAPPIASADPRAGHRTVPPPGEARQPQSPSPGFLNWRGRHIRSRRSSREPGLTRGPGSARQGRPRVHLGAGGLISAPRSFRITDGDRTASRVRSQPSGRLRLMCRPEVARFSV
ncbi:hypothetical protein NDU88_001859 [Pleurodeles waltl]|uniref:Uncharacterized protein n=1 Tax=Pleurodeles waltl TaxID=8319 RepID=A0AAV7VCP8_PLEWA|nr:hypothetical protein NDU88_001859 [Pleurodeles waltl]